MSQVTLDIDDRVTHVKEIGYRGDSSVPTSLQIKIHEDRRLALKVRVTSMTLKRPWVTLVTNPRITRLGRYACQFSAGTELEPVSSSAAIDPSSDDHFGKLFHGLSIFRHQGQDGLDDLVEKTFEEDPLRDMAFCGRYQPDDGVVAGVLAMNPGWRYSHAPVRNNAQLSVRYPQLLTLANPVNLTGMTVIEFKHEFSRSIAVPDGRWDYDVYNSSTVPRFRMPGWQGEYNKRQVGLQVGSDIADGLSLCHSYFHIPRNRSNPDPTPTPPTTRSLQFESAVTLRIEVTRV